MGNKNRGEITAFLSLVILLVLAVVGTVLESARVNVAKGYIDRALVMSMDNILAEYYYPLYEDYHLFFLDGGYGTGELDTERIITKMKENMKESFHPEIDKKGLGQLVQISNTDLIGIDIDKLEISKLTSAIDYDNAMYLYEAAAYMKYQIPAELMEIAAGNLSLSKKAALSSEAVGKKLEMEESAGALAVGMLDLMCQIEGIKVGKKGIQYSKNGLIKTEEDFVKKICIVEPDQNAVNISNSVVWNSLKSQYVNLIPLLDSVEEQMGILESCYAQTKEWKEALEALKGGNPEDTKEERVYIYQQFEKIGDEQQEAEKKIKQAMEQIKKVIIGAEKKIGEALKTIDSIEEKKKEADIKTQDYRQTMEKNKEDIPEEIYNSLLGDLAGQEEYLGSQENKKEYNLSTEKLQSMEAVLNSNHTILETVQEVTNLKIGGDEKNILKMKNSIISAKGALLNYNIKDLSFDYSTLKVDQNVKNPSDNFKKLIKQGILSLVVDNTEEISKKELASDQLPSSGLNSSQGDKSKELPADIADCNEGYQKEIANSFDDFAEKDKADPVHTEEAVINKILFQEYLLKHFRSYLSSEESKISRNGVLEYEQEYLLFGDKSDYKNVENVVEKLAFTRAILNFLYLITDKEKSDTAYACAAAIIGFTCVEPLVSLTKTIILMVWAYEEALVDVRGLLEGKYVPFFKSDKDFKISFGDLFLVSKALIKEKSEGLSEKKEHLDLLNYEDYMRMLLYCTKQKDKTLRSLDLIQENINSFYEGEFRMDQCIFGYKVKGDFNIRAKFIKLPFVQSVLKTNIEGYPYSSTKEQAY